MATDDTGSTSAATSSTGPEGSSSEGVTSVASSSSSSGADATTLVSDGPGSTTGGGSSTTGVMPPLDPGCPECIVLVDELVGGRGLAVDDTHVYFTDESQGTISRIMKGGGDGGVLVEGQDSPYDIAVDADYVYWTNFEDEGAVMRAPKEGGRAEVIAMVTRPRPVAVDGTHVYWGTFEIDDGDVFRRPVALDEPEELLASMFGGIADLVVGDGELHWTAHAEIAGGGFIVDPNEEAIGGVFSAALDGTADPFDPTVLATDQAQPWGIARAPDGTLVWANGDGAAANVPNALMTLPADGPRTVLYGGSSAPWGVAADSTFAYWTDNDLVVAFPLEGNQAIELADLQDRARSIAVDDDDVFWITRARVLQRAKPKG